MSNNPSLKHKKILSVVVVLVILAIAAFIVIKLIESKDPVNQFNFDEVPTSGEFNDLETTLPDQPGE